MEELLDAHRIVRGQLARNLVLAVGCVNELGEAI